MTRVLFVAFLLVLSMRDAAGQAATVEELFAPLDTTLNIQCRQVTGRQLEMYRNSRELRHLDELTASGEPRRFLRVHFDSAGTVRMLEVNADRPSADSTERILRAVTVTFGTRPLATLRDNVAPAGPGRFGTQGRRLGPPDRLPDEVVVRAQRLVLGLVRIPCAE